MALVYDTPPLESEKDPSIAQLNAFADRVLQATLPGSHLVEFFTWMRYLPSWMAKWKRDALDCYEKDNAFFFETLQ